MILLVRAVLREVREVYMQAIDIIRNRVCGRCPPIPPIGAGAPPWGRAPRKSLGLSVRRLIDHAWVSELRRRRKGGCVIHGKAPTE